MGDWVGVGVEVFVEGEGFRVSALVGIHGVESAGLGIVVAGPEEEHGEIGIELFSGEEELVGGGPGGVEEVSEGVVGVGVGEGAGVVGEGADGAESVVVEVAAETGIGRSGVIVGGDEVVAEVVAAGEGAGPVEFLDDLGEAGVVVAIDEVEVIAREEARGGDHLADAVAVRGVDEVDGGSVGTGPADEAVAEVVGVVGGLAGGDLR